MFPGMLLHVKEPPVPIELSVHHSSRLQVFSADMQDIIFFYPSHPSLPHPPDTPDLRAVLRLPEKKAVSSKTISYPFFPSSQLNTLASNSFI